MNQPTRQLRVWERIFDTYRVAPLSYLCISLKPTLRDLTGSNCLILTGVFIGEVLLRMCPSPSCKPQFVSSLWTSNDISGGHTSLLARATALQSPTPPRRNSSSVWYAFCMWPYTSFLTPDFLSC